MPIYNFSSLNFTAFKGGVLVLKRKKLILVSQVDPKKMTHLSS